MSWLSRLFAGTRARERRTALRAQDCPSCWKARAMALRWGKTACGECGKTHRASLFRLTGA